MTHERQEQQEESEHEKRKGDKLPHTQKDSVDTCKQKEIIWRIIKEKSEQSEPDIHVAFRSENNASIREEGEWT